MLLGAWKENWKLAWSQLTRKVVFLHKHGEHVPSRNTCECSRAGSWHCRFGLWMTMRQVISHERLQSFQPGHAGKMGKKGSKSRINILKPNSWLMSNTYPTCHLTSFMLAVEHGPDRGFSLQCEVSCHQSPCQPQLKLTGWRPGTTTSKVLPRVLCCHRGHWGDAGATLSIKLALSKERLWMLCFGADFGQKLSQNPHGFEVSPWSLIVLKKMQIPQQIMLLGYPKTTTITKIYNSVSQPDLPHSTRQSLLLQEQREAAVC